MDHFDKINCNKIKVSSEALLLKLIRVVLNETEMSRPVFGLNFSECKLCHVTVFKLNFKKKSISSVE